MLVFPYESLHVVIAWKLYFLRVGRRDRVKPEKTEREYITLNNVLEEGTRLNRRRPKGSILCWNNDNGGRDRVEPEVTEGEFNFMFLTSVLMIKLNLFYSAYG